MYFFWKDKIPNFKTKIYKNIDSGLYKIKPVVIEDKHVLINNAETDM